MSTKNSYNNHFLTDSGDPGDPGISAWIIILSGSILNGYHSCTEIGIEANNQRSKKEIERRLIEGAKEQCLREKLAANCSLLDYQVVELGIEREECVDGIEYQVKTTNHNFGKYCAEWKKAPEQPTLSKILNTTKDKYWNHVGGQIKRIRQKRL